jgi:hypothetical protein
VQALLRPPGRRMAQATAPAKQLSTKEAVVLWRSL